MAKREILKAMVLEALVDAGQPLGWVDCAKAIWNKRQDDLLASGDVFYTWQYDMRWAMQVLRDEDRVQRVGRGKWEAR